MFRDYNKRIYDVGQVIVIILSEEKTGEQRHEESTKTRVLQFRQQRAYIWQTKSPWKSEDVWFLSDSHLQATHVKE